MKPIIQTPKLCGAIALCLISGLSQAVTFNVTRFDDPIPNGCVSNDCSLREAVIAADATVAVDTIMLGSGTYELTQNGPNSSEDQRFDLKITSDLNMVGQGAELTIIRNATRVTSSTGTRVMAITHASVSLNQLSLRDGFGFVYPFQGVARGGCLFAAEATLSLSQVNLSNCEIYDPLYALGGAIALWNTSAEFTDVIIENSRNLRGSGGGLGMINSSADFSNVIIRSNAAYSGGGIAAGSDSAMTGDNVQVVSNRATQGGAMSLGEAQLNWSTGSRIAQNTAILDGGVIYVTGSGTVSEIAPNTDASIDRDDLLLIEDNHAGRNGGGIYVGINEYNNSPEIGTLDAARIALRLNTTGASGGGVYVKGKAHISDSEIAMNSAAMNVGGIALAGVAIDNLIERTSLVSNTADRDGGALWIGADKVKLRNVSTYLNNAIGYGGGVAVAPRSSVNPVQFTSAADTAEFGGSVALAINSVARVRNSALAAGCFKSSLGASLIDDGGNAQQSSQPACTGATLPASKMALQYGCYGGRFDVVGVGSNSALREFAAIVLEARTDIRGWKRNRNADAGAFEFDGTN
jgi:predicted outer membrane repeat protein